MLKGSFLSCNETRVQGFFFLNFTHSNESVDLVVLNVVTIFRFLFIFDLVKQIYDIHVFVWQTKVRSRTRSSLTCAQYLLPDNLETLCGEGEKKCQIGFLLCPWNNLQENEENEK